MRYIIGLTVLVVALWLLVSTWVNRDRPFMDAMKDRRQQRYERFDRWHPEPDSDQRKRFFRRRR